MLRMYRPSSVGEVLEEQGIEGSGKRMKNDFATEAERKVECLAEIEALSNSLPRDFCCPRSASFSFRAFRPQVWLTCIMQEERSSSLESIADPLVTYRNIEYVQ